MQTVADPLEHARLTAAHKEAIVCGSDRLDYLEDLGVTALYFNPLNDSPSPDHPVVVIVPQQRCSTVAVVTTSSTRSAADRPAPA